MPGSTPGRAVVLIVVAFLIHPLPADGELALARLGLRPFRSTIGAAFAMQSRFPLDDALELRVRFGTGHALLLQGQHFAGERLVGRSVHPGFGLNTARFLLSCISMEKPEIVSGPRPRANPVPESA